MRQFVQTALARLLLSGAMLFPTVSLAGEFSYGKSTETRRAPAQRMNAPASDGEDEPADGEDDPESLDPCPEERQAEPPRLRNYLSRATPVSKGPSSPRSMVKSGGSPSSGCARCMGRKGASISDTFTGVYNFFFGTPVESSQPTTRRGLKNEDGMEYCESCGKYHLPNDREVVENEPAPSRSSKASRLAASNAESRSDSARSESNAGSVAKSSRRSERPGVVQASAVDQRRARNAKSSRADASESESSSTDEALVMPERKKRR